MSGIEIFDTSLILGNRKRIQDGFPEYDFLHNEVLQRLDERFLDVSRDFVNILEISSRKNLKSDNAKFYDLLENREVLNIDKSSLDCVFSNLNLHWINDLPGVFIQINNILKPDGMFLASVFGGDSLSDLRQALMQAEMEISGGVSPRISPFIDIKDMGALMQRAGFALPVVDSDTITVEYSDIFKLMKDLKGMGEGNCLSQRRKNFTPKAVFDRAAEIYPKINGKIEAKFEILYIIGWKKHKSQQQPAKRGTGQINLSEILE